MIYLILFIIISLYAITRGSKNFILFFVAFYPILPEYFAIEIGSGLPLLTASRFLILLLIVFVILFKRKLCLIRNKLRKSGIFFAFCCYFVCRIIANGYYLLQLPDAINAEFTILFEQLLLVFLICQVVKNKNDVLDCVKTIVNTSGIIAIISIINVILGSNIFYNLNTVNRDILMAETIRMGIVRAEATFGHPVYYGMYCLLVIPLAMFMWRNSNKKRLYGLIFLLNIIIALLTESRGIIVVIIGIIIVLLFMMDKVTRHKIWKAVISITVVSFLLSFLVPNLIDQFVNVFKSVVIAFGNNESTIENFGANSTTGLTSRIIQLTGIVWMLMHNPVFGLGAKCHLRGTLSYYKNGTWFVRDTIDNGFVAYFVNEGILGGIACFVLFISIIRNSWQRSNFHQKSNLNNVFFLCFISYFFGMLSVADTTSLLWIIIALYIVYNSVNLL